MLGLALYVIAQAYQWASNDKVIKRTVRCMYCRKWIGEKVREDEVAMFLATDVNHHGIIS